MKSFDKKIAVVTGGDVASGRGQLHNERAAYAVAAAGNYSYLIVE